jgi:hypothetical protein
VQVRLTAGILAIAAVALPQRVRRAAATGAGPRLPAERQATDLATSPVRAATVTETVAMRPSLQAMAGRQNRQLHPMDTATLTVRRTAMAPRQTEVRLPSRPRMRRRRTGLQLHLAQAHGRLRRSGNRLRQAQVSGTAFPAKPSRRPSRRRSGQMLLARHAPLLQTPRLARPMPKGADRAL